MLHCIFIGVVMYFLCIMYYSVLNLRMPCTYLVYAQKNLWSLRSEDFIEQDCG